MLRLRLISDAPVATRRTRAEQAFPTAAPSWGHLPISEHPCLWCVLGEGKTTEHCLVIFLPSPNAPPPFFPGLGDRARLRCAGPGGCYPWTPLRASPKTPNAFDPGR